jgi:hypothetical protein
MDWATIAQLIITIGLPAVQKLIQNFENKTPVTAAEIQQLMDLAGRTSQDRMKAMIVSSGLTLDDPKVQALLQLTAGVPNLTITPPQPPA